MGKTVVTALKMWCAVDIELDGMQQAGGSFELLSRLCGEEL